MGQYVLQYTKGVDKVTGGDVAPLNVGRGPTALVFGARREPI